MAQQDNIFSIRLVKKDGKLIHQTTAEFGLYKDFVNNMEEGQVVETFFEANKDDGTNAQLAKIHVCIRKLAVEMGYSFEEMKFTIKREAGLVYDMQEGRQVVKSLADCSKEELGSVIQAIDQAGEIVNISFG